MASRRRQYVLAVVGNMVTLVAGYTVTWTSPLGPRLLDEFATGIPFPVPITTEEYAWIGSLLSIGGIVGPFITGLLSKIVGRTKGISIASISLATAWVLIAVAKNVYYVYAARLLAGAGAAMSSIFVTMYLAELASVDVRGSLGTFLQTSLTLGMLMMYSIGPYVTYAAAAYVGIGLSLVFPSLMFLMPESPLYLLSKGDKLGATAALAKIRAASEDEIRKEIEIMAIELDEQKNVTAKPLDIWRIKSNRKAILIVLITISIQQLSGYNAVMFYMSNIFNATSSSFDANISSIVVASVQVVAATGASLFVDKLGRKFLLITSSAGSAISLGVLGIYYNLESMDEVLVRNVEFLPLLCLVVYMIVYCIGLGALPWVLLGELFTMEMKPIAMTIAITYLWCVTFIVTRFFGPLAEAVGMAYVFWLFAGVCTLSVIFVLLFVPETKGKTINEIQDILKGR